MAKLRDNFSLQDGLFLSDAQSDSLKFTFAETSPVRVTFESETATITIEEDVTPLFGDEDQFNLIVDLPAEVFGDGDEIQVTINADDAAGNRLDATSIIILRYQLDASGQLVADLMSYPNPFSPLGWAGDRSLNQTTIRYVVGSNASSARLKIYSAYGELIYSQSLDGLSQGEHLLPWSGLDFYGEPLSSGVYFCVLEADGAQGPGIGKFKIAIANSLRR